MAVADVGLRLALQQRKETVSGLDEVKDGLQDVQSAGDKASTGLGKASDQKIARGFAAIKREASGVAGVVGRGIVGAAKVGGAAILGVAAAAAGVLGVALTKGFQRLNAIDQAKAKLLGLGNSTKTVTKIMNNALASVKGTAFGLDEAATVSAGAVAAGIKPGRDLTKTLKLVADAATIGGTSLGDMGAIFNKVAASNKLQGDTIAQLNDAGIPIVQMLGKQLHLTSAEVIDLASKGKIGFAQFSKAMQAGLGGAALKSGNTFEGSRKNLMASLGRIGAGLESGLFPHLAPAIQGVTKALAPLEVRAGSVGAAIGKRLGPWLEKLGPWLTTVVAKLDHVNFSKLGSGSGTISKIGDSVRKLGQDFDGVDWSEVGQGIGEGTANTITVFAVAMKVAADHAGLLAKVLPALVAAYAVSRAAQAAENVLAIASLPIKTIQAVSNFRLASSNTALAAAIGVSNAAETEGTVVRERGIVAMVAEKTAAIAGAAATKVMAAGQWLLNAAMSANPIGLVVIAIAALAGGFYLLWTRSSTFRGIVLGLWNGVLKPFGKFVGTVLVGYFKLLATTYLTMARVGVTAFTWLLKAAFTTFDGILDAADKGLGWVPGLGGKIHAARAAFDDFGDATISKLHGVSDALRDAQNKVNGLAQDRKATITIAVAYTQSGQVNPQARAFGGPVARGIPYIVGERRPEVFVPNQDGRIVPRVPASYVTSAHHQVDTQAVAATAGADHDTHLALGASDDLRPVVIQNILDKKVLSESTIQGVRARVARA